MDIIEEHNEDIATAISTSTPTSSSFECTYCHETFEKRNRLFKHLRSHGVYPNNEVTYIRICLLVGWISKSPEGDATQWVRDGTLSYGTRNTVGEDVESALWNAIKIVEEVPLDDEYVLRPKGLSRASSCALRGLESSTHGIGDLFSMQASFIHTKLYVVNII